jgi:hypothetical protein
MDEIAAIDEFRFQTRMPNRATAIRELLRRGLGFHPRQPELFCAAELFFSLLSGGGNGQAAWQNQGISADERFKFVGPRVRGA